MAQARAMRSRGSLCRRHREPGRPLALAGAAQRRVRGARAGRPVALVRLRGARPARRAAALAHMRRRRRHGPLGHHAAQGRRGRRWWTSAATWRASARCGQLRPSTGTVPLFGTNTDGAGFRGVTGPGRGRSTRRASAASSSAPVARRGRSSWRWPRPAPSRSPCVNRTAERACEAADPGRGPAGAVVAAGTPSPRRWSGPTWWSTPPRSAWRGGAAGGGEDGSWRPGLLREGQVAADLVYVPRPTAWLDGRRPAGAMVLDGLGMLVHQAAAQIALWTGASPRSRPCGEAAEAAARRRR